MKDKLVALLEQYGQVRGEVYIDIEADKLADFLLANGVTVEEDA
jgi:hypothetical protein